MIKHSVAPSIFMPTKAIDLDVVSFSSARKKAGNLRQRYRTSTAQYHNYLFKYVCELHNVTANKTLNYITPHEKMLGDTLDVSHLRFK